MTSFDYNYQNALRQAIVFSVFFFCEESLVTQVYITNVAAKCVLVVVVKWRHPANVLLLLRHCVTVQFNNRSHVRYVGTHSYVLFMYLPLAIDVRDELKVRIEHFHVTSLPSCWRAKTIHFLSSEKQDLFLCKTVSLFQPPTWPPWKLSMGWRGAKLWIKYQPIATESEEYNCFSRNQLVV